MMIETPELFKKAAEKCGFIRETYNESKMPTSIQNAVILPFFGDLKGSFVLSTLLLKRYREEDTKSCSKKRRLDPLETVDYSSYRLFSDRADQEGK